MHIPDATKSSNRFYVKTAYGRIIDFRIPVGSHEIADIIQLIQVKLNGNNIEVNITINDKTFTCVLDFENDCEIDFSVEDSILPTLGFKHIKLNSAFKMSNEII